MAHFAIVVPVWVGHLNPMTTLGRELQRRGHRISVLSFPDAADRIKKSGLSHIEIGASTFPVGEWELLTRKLSVRSGMSAAHFTVRWLERITSVMLNELPGELRRGGYDGVIMDQVCFGAEFAADAARIPLVMACNALPIHLQPDIPIHSETWAWDTSRLALARNWVFQRFLLMVARSLWSPVRAARKAAGQPWDLMSYLNEVPPSLAQIAQLPACLDFPRNHAPDHFHLTGPWHEPGVVAETGFDWSWMDGRPLIYASLGTLQNGLDHLYQLILDACANLPMQIVLALGRENGSPPSRIPGNARVLGYCPQVALLKRSSMVITHAGLNTTLESLSQGLPLVAMPIANEQPGIASRIRHTGVGDWISIRNLTPEKLRRMVLKVHGTPEYRVRAQESAREIAKQEGLKKAAEIAEEALLTRRRIIRT